MHLLPKANPLKEHLPANRGVITNVLKKLGEESFTGYMNLKASGYNAFCIFALGNMVSVVSIDHATQTTGFDAFEHMLDRVFTSEAEINVYRMTPDLVMCAHALLLGKKLYSNEVIRQIDMKAIFAELKNLGLNGVVRFNADDRLAMLFFKAGNPIGFYTNGAKSIDTSPEESRKIAAMPGAKLDVFSINPQEDILPYDLLHMFNIDKTWDHLVEKHAVPAITPVAQPVETAPAEAPAPVAEPAVPEPEAENQPVTNPFEPADSEVDISSLIEDLQDVAIAYLSKAGGEVIERQLENAGGPSVLYHSEDTDRFLGMVFMESMKIDDHARIEEMIQLMRSEIEERVHNRL